MEQIWEAIKHGVPFSVINVVGILGFSLVIIIERTYYIFKNYRVSAPNFFVEIKKLVQSGNIDRAIRMCEAGEQPLLEITRAGLTQKRNGEEAVMAKLDEAMGEYVPALEKRIPWLWTLANLATLVGLVGTISGLIKAFAAVGEIDDPAEKTKYLSIGISEAMWNTFFGLVIAVVCMAGHLFLHSLSKKNKSELERTVTKLENLLTLEQ